MPLPGIITQIIGWIVANPVDAALLIMGGLTLLTLWKNRIIKGVKTLFSPIRKIKIRFSLRKNKQETVAQVTNVNVNATAIQDQINDIKNSLTALADIVKTLSANFQERRLVPAQQPKNQQ